VLASPQQGGEWRAEKRNSWLASLAGYAGGYWRAMAVFDRLSGPREGVTIGLSQILPLQNLSLVLPEPPVEPAQKRTGDRQ
jgi:hypothetical protein